MLLWVLLAVGVGIVTLLGTIWFLYRSGIKLGEEKAKEHALEEANKAYAEAQEKYGKITQETLAAKHDGDVLMCDILRPKD